MKAEKQCAFHVRTMMLEDIAFGIKKNWVAGPMPTLSIIGSLER